MNQNSVRLLRLFLAVAALVAVPLGAQQVRRTLPGTRPVDTTAAKTAAVENTASDPAAPVERGIGVIDGIVTDSALHPLLGARVTILRTQIKVGTGGNGRFQIRDIPTGQYLLIVQRAGYHPTSAVVQVDRSDTLRLAYSLQIAPQSLAPVMITEKRQSVRMQEFEYRRKLGIGQFMDQAEIEKHNSAYATELLRRFTTIDAAPTSGGGGQDVYYPVSQRATGGGTSTGLATCFMTVYIDNVPMPSPFNLDLLPSPRELSGIEVYAGSSETPLQYAGFGSSCGVILVWTRDGVGESSKP